MNREQVIATLRGYESELRAAGIIRLSLSGSTARGDDRPDSDIGLLAAFDDIRRVEEGTLKPRVRKNVEAEAVRAF
jgi:uncharacterized protein